MRPKDPTCLRSRQPVTLEVLPDDDPLHLLEGFARPATAGPGYVSCTPPALIMMHGIHRDSHVETLLNSLQAERYMRAALLMTIVDELDGDAALGAAAAAARAMLNDVATLSDSDLERRIDVVRQLVRTIASPDLACA